jgi:hypothetical protein
MWPRDDVDGGLLPRLGDHLSDRGFCAATRPMKPRPGGAWSIEEAAPREEATRATVVKLPELLRKP